MWLLLGCSQGTIMSFKVLLLFQIISMWTNTTVVVLVVNWKFTDYFQLKTLEHWSLKKIIKEWKLNTSNRLVQENRGGLSLSIEINNKRIGKPEIRSAYGEQVFHDMNDWPQFMNNNGEWVGEESAHFSLFVVFGSPTILLFSTRLFELLLFLCVLFSCFFFIFILSLCPLVSFCFFIDFFCLVFLPSFIFLFTPLHPYSPTRVFVLVVGIAQTGEMVHLL